MAENAESTPTGAETRAAVRGAAPQKAAATKRAQRAATAAAKKAEGPKGKKVRVKMRSAGWKRDAGVTRSFDADTANDLIANGHAVALD